MTTFNYYSLLGNTVYGTPSGNYDGTSTAFVGDYVTASSYYGAVGTVQTVTTIVTDFVGQINIQATLNDNPEQAEWFDIADIDHRAVTIGNAANAVTTQTTYSNIAGISGEGLYVYKRVPCTSTGNGTGATFDITLSSVGSFYAGNTVISVANGGSEYGVTDTITISGVDLNGLTPDNDLTFVLGNTVAEPTNGTTATSIIGNFVYMRVAVRDFTAGTINSIVLTY